MAAPEYCMRDGKKCAFRMFCSVGYGQTACGYMFFTNKRRGCDAENCNKWAEEIPKGINDECDIDEDIPDIDNSAECAGCDDLLYIEGLEEGSVLDVCSGT